jgi:Flp pilus assembly protein TadG
VRLSHRPRFVPGRHRHERGAVLVEFATVAIFLAVMLAGAFDYGMAWRASLTVTEAARAGARVGSSGGNNLAADRDLLLSAQAALSAGGMLDEVQRVVIFNASNVSAVPTACKQGTGTTQSCNALTGAQFSNLTATSAYDSNGCIVDSARKGFCPKLRNNVQLTAHYVGIWILADYEYEFGLLGSTRSIERTAIMRIEPP